MAQQEEISDVDWLRAKHRGYRDAGEDRNRVDRDAARDLATKKAAQLYGRANSEEENAYYQGFMERLGY